jgi:hypothetical protein
VASPVFKSAGGGDSDQDAPVTAENFTPVAGALLVAVGTSRHLFTDRTRTVGGPGVRDRRATRRCARRPVTGGSLTRIFCLTDPERAAVSEAVMTARTAAHSAVLTVLNSLLPVGVPVDAALIACCWICPRRTSRGCATSSTSPGTSPVHPRAHTDRL